VLPLKARRPFSTNKPAPFSSLHPYNDYVNFSESTSKLRRIPSESTQRHDSPPTPSRASRRARLGIRVAIVGTQDHSHACFRSIPRPRMSEPRFLTAVSAPSRYFHTFPRLGLRNSFPRRRNHLANAPRWVILSPAALASQIWPVDSRDLASVAKPSRNPAQRWKPPSTSRLWKSALSPFCWVPKRIAFFSNHP